MAKTPKKELFLDANLFETRLAVTEDEKLTEFLVERRADRGYSGNIYKGKIVRVLPGMQAAFVEIGLDRTAFLHVSDVLDKTEHRKKTAKTSDKEKENTGKKPGARSRRDPSDLPRIQDLLNQGQDILVQVEKEPIGDKGARLTSYVSLPGRYLVLMPTHGKIAISRRISDPRERRRLRDMVRSFRPPGFGFIIRTVCVGRSTEEIQADMEFLVKLWGKVSAEMNNKPTPSLLYEELDLTLRTIRDTLGPDVSRLMIDSREEYERADNFMQEYLPITRGKVECHDGKESMFDAYGIEVELTKALERKVWLPSGGFLVMDQMEALTAIDVNTGKYVGKKNSEQTILKTNLEAIDEVVHQLKLRNIGGIIVIDFIDMEKTENREKVYKTLKLALKRDKARTNILKISDLGIVEMTRKRTRESLSQALLEPCPYCDGNALVKDRDTVAMEIFRDLLRELPTRRLKTLVYVSPLVAERLKEPGGVIEELKKRFRRKVVIKPVDTFHQEEYEIV